MYTLEVRPTESGGTMYYFYNLYHNGEMVDYQGQGSAKYKHAHRKGLLAMARHIRSRKLQEQLPDEVRVERYTDEGKYAGYTMEPISDAGRRPAPIRTIRGA